VEESLPGLYTPHHLGPPFTFQKSKKEKKSGLGSNLLPFRNLITSTSTHCCALWRALSRFSFSGYWSLSLWSLLAFSFWRNMKYMADELEIRKDNYFILANRS